MEKCSNALIISCLLALFSVGFALSSNFEKPDFVELPLTNAESAEEKWYNIREAINNDLGEELGLTAINDDIPLQNCAVHEMSLPGQKFRAGGSNGGRLPPGEPLDPSQVIADFAYINDYTPIRGLLRNFNEDVAIIVLDSFLGGDDHGQFVVDHLTSLIMATGNFSTPTALAGNGLNNLQFSFKDNSGKSLLIAQADYGDAISTSIASTLRSTVKTLEGMSYENIVVNMSFVLIPCATLEAFKASNFPTFETYIYALAQAVDNPNNVDIQDIQMWRDCSENSNTCVNGVDLASSNPEDFLNNNGWILLQTLIKPSIDDDPLLCALGSYEYEGELQVRCNLDDPPTLPSDILYAASAGNFSLPYSMFPAADPRVISVSAYRGTPDFSNSGSIIEVGAWYQSGSGSYYAGTSFSAPVVSLFIAAGMSAGDICATRNSNGLPKLTEWLNSNGQSNMSLREVYQNSGGCM